jgi:hypothetical protein
LSTDSAIYVLLNDVLTALNNKSKVKGIFCDIEKAFDSVNHDILLHKLEIYGVTATTRELFSQFLSNRHQHVNLKVNLRFLRGIRQRVKVLACLTKTSSLVEYLPEEYAN